MLARYYLKRRDVSELLLNFDYFIIAEVIPLMKYCCYYGHQCSAHDFPGFDWENPVLSSFEDWVMGWENETGRMDYKFFWGGEGDTPFMTAPFSLERKWGVPSEKKSPPPRQDFSLCAPRTHVARSNQPQARLLSAPRAMFTLWCLR